MPTALGVGIGIPYGTDGGTGGGGGLPLPPSVFVATYTNGTATPTIDEGSGYTYSRTGTTETITEGVGNNLVKSTLENEIGFDGQRRVENLCANFTNVSNFPTNEGTGFTKEDLGGGRYRITKIGNGPFAFSDTSVTTIGQYAAVRIGLKWVTGTPKVCTIGKATFAGANNFTVTPTTSDAVYGNAGEEVTFLPGNFSFSVTLSDGDQFELWDLGCFHVDNGEAPPDFVSTYTGTGDELIPTQPVDTDWVASGTNAVDQDGDAVKVTYVDNAFGAVLDLDTFGNLIDLPAGKLVCVTAEVKTTGSLQYLFDYGSTSVPITVNSANYKTITFVQRLDTDTGRRLLFNNMGAGEVAWIKNISIKEIDHGTNVDGVKYFPYANGNTVDGSNVVTEAQGATIAEATNLGVNAWEQRTNKITQSEDITHTDWVKDSSDPVSNLTTAPDGTSNADRLIDDASTGTGAVYVRRSGYTLTSGADECVSVFAKADALNFLIIGTTAFDASAAGTTWFNLSTGAIGTQSGNHSDAGMEDFGNGWYRCWIIFQSTTDLTGIVRFGVAEADNDLTVDLDGTSSIFLWGAQGETGSFVSPYIPTTTSTATRNADDLEYDAANYADEMTVLCEFELPRDGDVSDLDQQIMSIAEDGNNYILFMVRNNGLARLRCRESATDKVIAQTPGVVTAGAYKAAFTVSKTAGQSLFSFAGTGYAPSTDAGMPALTPVSFYVGSNYSNASHLNGNIKQLQISHGLWTQAQLDAWTGS